MLALFFIAMLKWIFRVVIYAGLLVALAAVIAFFYPEKFLCVDSGRVSADVIILLGGGSHDRPERAAELFKAQAASRIIISGEGDDEINRQLLIQAGVPAGAIQFEGKSRTTRERGELKCFEHFAPEIKFYSRPSYFAFAREGWTRLGISKRMRLEFLKLPGYWIRYGVNPF